MSDVLRRDLAGRIDRALVPLIGGGDVQICLVDPPDHPNVGDNAILLGELDFLARHFPHCRLSIVDVHSYAPAADRFIARADLLLLHGGGNFGDIWPRHHEFRLHLLQRFPGKKAIQLPQSVHFDDAAALRRTAAIIAAHRDFTLLLRDRASLEMARRHFDCRLDLVPDMAFAMRPIQRAPARTDIFGLLRTDKEALLDRARVNAVLAASGHGFEMADWLDEPPGLVARADHRLGWLARHSPVLGEMLRTTALRLREARARARLAAGVRMLSRGRLVVTDRLHGHILCCLLDIPHFAFDCYDGKIGALHRTWTATHPGAWLVGSAADLAAALRRMLIAAE